MYFILIKWQSLAALFFFLTLYYNCLLTHKHNQEKENGQMFLEIQQSYNPSIDRRITLTQLANQKNGLPTGNSQGMNTKWSICRFVLLPTFLFPGFTPTRNYLNHVFVFLCHHQSYIQHQNPFPCLCRRNPQLHASLDGVCTAQPFLAVLLALPADRNGTTIL